MDKRVFRIFDQIQAEGELKKKTSSYLHAEIQKRKNRGRIYNGRFAIACLLAVFLLCGWSWNKMYFTPSAYIDIDINPSIELTINRFGKVIHAGAYNGDGAGILESVNLRYANYDDAVTKLLTAMNASGYFEQDNLLSITVQTNENVEENSILEGLREAIDNASKTHQFDTVANIFAVTEEVKHCANEHHISPAKYLAIEELLQVDSTADFEDCKEHSISELQRLAQERCAEQENEGESDEHEDGDNSHEHENGDDSYEHENGNDSYEHENGNDSYEHENGNDSYEHEKGDDSYEHENGVDSYEHENGSHEDNGHSYEHNGASHGHTEKE